MLLKLFLLSVLEIATVSDIGRAGDLGSMPKDLDAQSEQLPPTELEQVVALCAKQIHNESASSKFDAYVQRGVVESFGTDQERFRFRKCMAQREHPLGPSLHEKK